MTADEQGGRRLGRRRLLGMVGAGAAALAGCLGGGNDCVKATGLSLEPATDSLVREEYVRDLATLHPVGRRLVEAALADGPATLTAPVDPPVPDDEYVAAGDGYYELSVRERGVEEATGYEYHVESGEEVPPPEDGEAIEFDALPPHDRRTFLLALPFHPDGEVAGAPSVRATALVAYADPDRLEASVFVPDLRHRYVRFRGTDYRLTLEESRSVGVWTRAVEARLIADAGSGLAAHAREARGTTLDRADLPPDQREVLDAAAGDHYSECNERSRELEAVLDRVEDVDFVRYDGEWYHVEIDVVVA